MKEFILSISKNLLVIFEGFTPDEVAFRRGKSSEFRIQSGLDSIGIVQKDNTLTVEKEGAGNLSMSSRDSISRMSVGHTEGDVMMSQRVGSERYDFFSYSGSGGTTVWLPQGAKVQFGNLEPFEPQVTRRMRCPHEQGSLQFVGELAKWNPARWFFGLRYGYRCTCGARVWKSKSIN